LFLVKSRLPQGSLNWGKTRTHLAETGALGLLLEPPAGMALEINALLSRCWICMGWMLCGLAGLAQDSASGIAPNQPDKHIIAIFRFDPQTAEIGRLETEFAKAREMFLHDLVAEYHSSGLTIQ